MVITAHGSGSPVTLIVPGLAATTGEARLPASGLPGTRVVLTLPSHGAAPDAEPGYWTYARVANDVLAAAAEVNATRAIGVSLGAGALAAVLTTRPGRFERLALLLPAAFARPRQTAAVRNLLELAEALDDPDRLRTLVTASLPDSAGVGTYADDRIAALRRLGPALRSLSTAVPVPDVSRMADVTAKVLVIGSTGDPAHPAEVAEETAAGIPGAELVVLPSRAPLITHRAEIRGLLRSWLS
ncbi:alpha/beta hydrolase [Pseudonocardiaceae bacterium YIM PH 21723]|nr:alpha/beta hydrolase [Pseudonocardiaceae bacterium YIM PH 21723]